MKADKPDTAERDRIVREVAKSYWNHGISFLGLLEACEEIYQRAMERAAQDDCKLLQDVLDQLPNYKAADWPERSHRGSCGPEAGCDATCMDIAAMADTMQLRRRIAARLRAEGGE